MQVFSDAMHDDVLAYNPPMRTVSCHCVLHLDGVLHDDPHATVKR